MSPMVLIGSGALVLFAGVAIGLWLGSVYRARESAKSAEIQEELDRYRREVTDHFSVTAAHFQSIGEEYKKLYDHMATGVNALCDSAEQVGFIKLERHDGEPRSVAEGDQAPRDYEISVPDDVDQELPEIIPGDAAMQDLPDIEPTDEELAQAEAAEELLVDPDLVVDDGKGEKTLH